MRNKPCDKQIEYSCVSGVNDICPFNSKRCKKLPRSNIGICSFLHGGSQQIICPCVFEKSDYRVIIEKKILGCRSSSVYPEVKIGDNFFDYLVVDDDNEKQYCAVEIQSLDTTGNYKWVLGEKVKPFCINWNTTKKTIISQLITKLTIFQSVGKAVVLVIQDSFWKYLSKQTYAFDKSKELHILSYHYYDGRFDGYELMSLTFDELCSLLFSEKEYDVDKIVCSLKNGLKGV